MGSNLSGHFWLVTPRRTRGFGFRETAAPERSPRVGMTCAGVTDDASLLRARAAIRAVAAANAAAAASAGSRQRDGRPPSVPLRRVDEPEVTPGAGAEPRRGRVGPLCNSSQWRRFFLLRGEDQQSIFSLRIRVRDQAPQPYTRISDWVPWPTPPKIGKRLQESNNLVHLLRF